MKKLVILGAVGAVIVILGVPWEQRLKPSEPVYPVACSMIAKLCPDGTAVGRVGPNCEFAPCPGENGISRNDSIIEGKVSIGPICPVERPGMPCQASPEAYLSREIALYSKDGKKLLQTIHFNQDGTYRFVVAAGTYILTAPKVGIDNSKDLPKLVSVKPGETVEFDFSIDTGIR